MPISCGRREFLRLGLGAVGAGAFAGCFCCDGRLGAVSRFRGIQLGAITYSFRSMPGRETDALAKIADRNDVRIAFHNHGQLTRDTYEGALLGYSQNLGINFDIGHYVSANDDDPLAFVRRFHDRIASVHLKDRTTKAHGQKNLPWGEGETPLGPLFALMLKEGYGFHADVELEYRIPSGSNAVREVARCIRHAQGLIG